MTSSRSTPARTTGISAVSAKDGGKPSRLVRYPTATNAMRALLSDVRADHLEVTFKPTVGARLNLDARPSPSERSKPSANALRLIKNVVQGSYPLKTYVYRTPSRAPLRMEAVALTDTETLGEMVRIRRHMLKLSQQQLADRAGVGRRFVSDLENGKATVELGRVLSACHVLGLTLTLQATDGG